jgi:hypothetical protein
MRKETHTMRQQQTTLSELRKDIVAAGLMLIVVSLGTVLVMLLIGGGH